MPTDHSPLKQGWRVSISCTHCTHCPSPTCPLLQLLCRNSGLGSPSHLCSSPPGPSRKASNLEGLVFPGESSLAPGSYKKAPGFEREDQVGVEYLKNFKCQVKDSSSRGCEASELSLLWAKSSLETRPGSPAGRTQCLQGWAEWLMSVTLLLS